MSATLVVPPSRLAALQVWVDQQKLPVTITTAAQGSSFDGIRVEEGDRSRQSEPALLVAGGRIRCAVALGVAKRLGIPTLALGALLDELEIKVGSCSLGCF